MRPLLRVLEVLSILELLCIAVLLGNLLIVHVDGVASVLGPVHGALYLAVAVIAMFGRGLLLRTRLLALIPVLGGVFTLINVRREARREHPRERWLSSSKIQEIAQPWPGSSQRPMRRDWSARYRERMLFFPGSPQYEAATQPDNSIVAQSPALVATPRTAADVAEVVLEAARTGRTVVVQATGHGAGAAVSGDTILLDTSALDDVAIDPEARSATVGVGARWAKVNEAAFAHGLLGLAGSSPSVGVSGYTFGGGIGWLGRSHGMAASSLNRVTFVDGEGQVRVASEDAADAADRDALWAFRGAGGVGIAVSLEFEVFPAADLHAGFLLWPASELDPVVAAWTEATKSTASSVASSISVLRIPDAPVFPESLRGTPAVLLALADPDGDGAGDLLQAVRSAASPVLDTWGPCDAQRLSQIHLDPPVAVPAHGDARWLNTPTSEQARGILRTATADGSPLAMIEIRHVATGAPARDGALTSPPSPYIYHAVGPVKGEADRAALDAAFSAARSAAGAADTGRVVGSWMEGAATVPDALPDDVRARAAAIADAVDPHARIRRSRLLG